MQKLLLYIYLIFVAVACVKNDDNFNKNPRNLIDLGLTPEKNKYPYYPETASFLGDNLWFDYMRGDTFLVRRRDNVSDDFGDELIYTFLIDKCKWIKPLRVKRISNESGTIPQFSFVVYDKPIENFKLQIYDHKQTLACQIETLEPNYTQFIKLTDKMWIDLSD